MRNFLRHHRGVGMVGPGRTDVRMRVTSMLQPAVLTPNGLIFTQSGAVFDVS